MQKRLSYLFATYKVTVSFVFYRIGGKLSGCIAPNHHVYPKMDRQFCDNTCIQ